LNHPPTVYLREDRLADGVNEWVSRLFSPNNLDETVALLAGAEGGPDPAEEAEVRFKEQIEAAESAMARLQRAMEAGWDPSELAAQFNAAVMEKRAAEAGLSGLVPTQQLTADDFREVVFGLGDMEDALKEATRERLLELYQGHGSRSLMTIRRRAADVSISPVPRVHKVGVRGGTCTLTTQFQRAS
jgi:hypothetical protein